MKIAVFVESEPHTIDTSDMLLNRPAPNGGSFMIGARIDRATWDQMKQAGASYWSAEELEDVDMFDAEPGWRYSSLAIEVLIEHGHELEVRDTVVTTVAEWRALWTDQAKAAYRARKAQEAATAAEAKAAAKAAAEAAREAAGAAYAAQVAELTRGLARTTIAPPAGSATCRELVLSVPAGTPGAWYDTGDRWYRISDTPIYELRYGSAVAYYAPQALVDSWCEAQDTGSVAFARHVVEYYGYAVYGADVAQRLVELHGIEHYLARATSEEWLIIASNARSRLHDVIAHYGIQVTPVAMQRYDFTMAKRIRTLFGFEPYDRNGPEAVGQTADGRWFATPDSVSGGHWRQLTDAQREALGLGVSHATAA